MGQNICLSIFLNCAGPAPSHVAFFGVPPSFFWVAGPCSSTLILSLGLHRVSSRILLHLDGIRHSSSWNGVPFKYNTPKSDN